jgi:hypothetical protein
MVNSILSQIDLLINHEFGNFIIQQIIYLKDVEYNTMIIDYIKSDLSILGKQKHSSNVIDKV